MRRGQQAVPDVVDDIVDAPADLSVHSVVEAGDGPSSEDSTFADVLDRALAGPLPSDQPAAEPARPPFGVRIDREPTVAVTENDRIRAEMLAARPTESMVAPEPVAPTASMAPVAPMSPVVSAEAAPVPPVEPVGSVPSPTPPSSSLQFWDRYDEASAAAQLFAVPPAAVTAVVGSLEVAIPVVDRCQASHWVSQCDVFVLTDRPQLVDDPTWVCLRRPSDVVALLENGGSDFPLIVIDVPQELPVWVRPLVARLREGGVGLVHYVLDGRPGDEDLATWHGEIGKPAVLDLADTVEPARVLELLDRGEPIASVGGSAITADLLLALRLAER
ncbi:MAG: hypothetical protein AAF547_18230 [Actinomycetota bacterium]